MSYHQMEIEGLARYYFILFFSLFLFLESLAERYKPILFCLLLPVSQRAVSTTTSSLSSFARVICICLFFCPTFQETLCFVDSCTDVAFCVNVRQKNNRNVNCIAATNQNMAPHTCCESNGEKIQSRTLGASLLGHYILLEVIMFTFSFSENGR